MTAKLGSAATAKTLERVIGPSGVNAGLAALLNQNDTPAALVDLSQVRAQNVAAELAERSAGINYPAINIYCEKLVNGLTEKFRSFSGTAQMAIEVRHSQDRLEGLQQAVEIYSDAVLRALDRSRGEWGDGMFYSGGYQAAFGPVKHGGRNFIQAAKITFEIAVSRS